MTSRPPRTASGRRPRSPAQPAGIMPKGILTWNGAWMLTSSSTGGSSARRAERQSMTDPGHWLAGRLAVVTGASRGIGAATAAALAAAGAHVVLAARDREALDRVGARIKDGGGQATPVPADLSNEAEVERLFAEVEQIGQLGALVCAAGVLTPAPFAETTSKMWDETLGVNLTGM